MLVYDLIKDQISIENMQSFSREDDVMIYAHYSNSVKPTYSEIKQVKAFIEEGWKVVVVTTNTYFTNKVTTVRKPNIGYDMGSWATALLAIPELRNVNRLILFNNSFYGPVQSIQKMLENFGNSDFWGMTKSYYIAPHIQSGIRGFSNKILQDDYIFNFLTRIEDSHPTEFSDYKTFIIMAYEVGFPLDYVSTRYNVSFMFGPVGSHSEFLDWTSGGWKKVIKNGAPFIKKSLAKGHFIYEGDLPVITLNDIIELQNTFGEDTINYFVK
jgi:Rhamnan synthesis protein F